MAELINTQQLMKLTGLSRKTINQYIDLGLPHTQQMDKRGKPNQFDKDTALDWIAKHAGDKSLKDQLLKEKIEHEQYKKRLTQLQVAEAEGRLVDKTKVEADNCAKFATIRAKFMALTNACTLLEGKPAKDMYEVLRAEIERILTELSRDGE